MRNGRLALAAAALTLTAGLALAQPPGGGPGGVGGRPGGPGGARHRGPFGLVDPRRVADYLQLTDAQRQSARQLFESRREQVRPLIEQQRDLREQLRTMLDDPAASDAALARIVRQLHANRKSLKAGHDEAMQSFRALLDDAQKAKLDAMKGVLEGLRSARRDRRR
jgi:Spy/CpxP family protein refolding chaperone